MGAKKKPFYRIVVADARMPRDGRFIEEVGTYDPLQSPSAVTWKRERIRYWLKNGAQPTETVRSLLVRTGLTDRQLRLRETPEEGAGSATA